MRCRPCRSPSTPPWSKKAGASSPAAEASPCNRGTSRARPSSEETPPPDAAARRQKRRNLAAGRRSCSPTAARFAGRHPRAAPREGPANDVFVCSGDRTAKAVGSGRPSAPGHAHHEAGTLREPGGHVDGSTVRLDHLAHDKEPDPQVPAAGTPAVDVVTAPERV